MEVRDPIDSAIVLAPAQLGFSDLRLKQRIVMKSSVGGHDMFVSLPTGSGKSLCYSRDTAMGV